MKFYCYTLGFFLFTAWAEKEDFQGYHTAQTKSVTRDLLLRKENTIGHGTEAIPSDSTHQHANVKFPEVITKALAIINSTSGFISSNGEYALKSTRVHSSAKRIHADSGTPMISNHGKIVFSSTEAALDSVTNGTSEPEVYRSAEALKASLWLHTPLDNGNQRNTDSITLTSADRGPGVPILSASHPRVIDNLDVLRNDNDDKRSQGEDDKGISNLGRNEYPLGTVQSIFRISDTAGDSVSGNLCLTCQKDRRAATSTEKSLPALSPDGSSDSLSIEGPALDVRHFTTSLPSLHQQSAGGEEEMLNKVIRQQNISKHSNVGQKEQLVYNLTFPPLSLNKTVNHSQSTLNNSHIRSFLSDTGTVDTQSLAEMSSATQKDTKNETLVAERLLSITTAFQRSSMSLSAVRKQETLAQKVSIRDPHFIYFSKHSKNASHSLATNLNNILVQKQPLDFNSGSINNSTDLTESPTSSQESVHPEGGDQSIYASHPTARMQVIDAYSAIASFRVGSPTTSAVKCPESHSLTRSDDSLISASWSQTAKPNCKTKEAILTLLLKKSGITERHLTNKQEFQTFNSGNNIVQQYVVDPLRPAYEPVMKKLQTPTLTTKRVTAPVNLYKSRRDFDNGVSTSTISSKSFSERLTMTRLLGSQSKLTQDRMFNASNDNYVAPMQQLFVKYNRDLIRNSLIVPNLKAGDKNEQVIEEDENKEIIKTEGEQGEGIKKTKKILKLQESREDEKLRNEREELLRSDKVESGKQEKIINTGVEMHQNTELEEDRMEEREARKEGGGGTVRKEDGTLRQDPRQENVRHKDDAEKQSVSLTKEGAKAAVNKDEITRNWEIGREDVTNVPVRPTTTSTEPNKGYTITNLSSILSLIKQFGAPENKAIHPGDKIVQIMEMKNKPFSYEVTSNHRPLHSTLSPELSRMTSFPKEPSTRIKAHPSTYGATLTKQRATSSLTKESTQNKVVKFYLTTIPKMTPRLSQPFGVSTSKYRDAMRPTISLHGRATASAHPVLKSISNTASLTTPRLAITAELQRAQPHFRVNTLSMSIIYKVSDHRHKFSALVSKENSPLQTTSEREQAEHIILAPILDSSVKDPLTSNITEEVNTSAPTQQMYNDLATRPPTAAALSSVAHTSIGHPPRRQSAPQTSRSASSSSDMTSGQPCSFTLSEQTAHSDALHAPVDDNEQRSVQALMTSMSPKAKDDQFSLSSVSLLPNLTLFGDDSLPGTYSPTGLTISASEKEILRADAEAGYANSGSGHSDSLLGTADEMNQPEEDDCEHKTATSGEKHSCVVKKQPAESKDEKNSSTFKEQTGRSKHHASSTEAFNSLSQLLTEKLAAENTNEDNHTDLFNVDGSDAENSTVTTSLKNNQNHPSHLTGYNETSAQTASTIQSTKKIVQAINDFVPVASDLAVPVLHDTNDPTGTTAFVESESLHEIPQIQANDVTNNAISGTGSHAAKTAEKQHDPSTLRGAAVDLKAPYISTQQIADRIMNGTSEFHMTTTKTNDFMSAAGASGLIVSTEAHESALTMSMQVVIEKASQAAEAERTEQSSSHIEPLSLREPPAKTVTTGKLAPAVKGRNTTETQSVKQPEREISVQTIKQIQHAPPCMIAIIRPSNDPGQSVQEGLLNSAHRAGGVHATSSANGVKYLSFKDIKTLTMKSAFKVNHPLYEITRAVHSLDRVEQETLPEQTSISQVILGAVTDSVPPTGITPTEIINKASCRTIGCAKSGETNETTIGAGEIDHTAREKTYETQAGNTGGDHFDAVHTPDTKPENGNCSTDRRKATPQATNLEYAALSPASSESDHSHKTTAKIAKSMTDETSTRIRGVLVETHHLKRRGEKLERAQFVEETTQKQHSHRQTSKTREAAAAEVTLSDPEATTAQATVKTTEQTLLAGKKIKTQLNGGAAKAEIFEAQNATRSARAVVKAETAVQMSGRRLLMPEPETESEQPGLKHISRRTSPHLYLSGVTEVSDDLCGTGNYTAEMSLSMGRGIEPGDTVPAPANLRVVINLKTNKSRINLGVTSCCLSPTTQPDQTNSTCCHFSRLAAEPAGITILPSALSTSASFTISLFRMINYTVVYLHCDLTVCPRNRSGCERCLQQRTAFTSEGLEAVGTSLRNRISFGPMLKEVKNSTFPEEIDPSELDLVLVIVSLAVGTSLVTLMLLLVWLAYRRRTIWLHHSATPPQACCGCLHPGGDLILP